MMDGLQIAIPRRMMLVRICLVCSLLISVLLTLPLWGSARFFPLTPLVDGAPGRALEIALLGFMLLFFLASMFLNAQRLLLFLGMAAVTVLVLYDINRLQPWIYIYCGMLMVYVFYNGRVDDPNNYTSYFIILQMIFASVYFFSGFHQLNCAFVGSDYSEIIDPLHSILSERQFMFFRKIGVMVPYFMMFIGIGLIISATRYLAITLGVILHIFLFIFLFPTRFNDYALWFSNISFVIMLLLLFSGKTKQRYFSPTFLFQKPLFYMAFILFVIMPFFNNSGGWPDHLAFNFKSGNQQKAMIRIYPEEKNLVPWYMRDYFVPDEPYLLLDYNSWCHDELHANCYSDVRVFNSISGSLRSSVKGNVKEIELIRVPRLPVLCKQ